MRYRVFEVPRTNEFVDALDVVPEDVTGEYAQRLTFRIGNEQLVLTFDVPGQSVHLLWTRDVVHVLEVFREGAVSVRFRKGNGATTVLVDFRTDDQRGVLEVQVDPRFAVTDRLLFG